MHEQALRRLGLLVAVLLLLLQVLVAFAGSGTFDTYRDLYYAAGIAAGSEFPSAGPLVFNTAHMGPVWYYVLAFPMAIGGIPAAIGFAAFLSGLKYPLLFRLMSKLFGVELALLGLAAYALLGWSLFAPVFLTHASVVETLLILYGLACLRLRTAPSLANAALAGLLAALAVHGHPTVLPALAAGLIWSLYPTLMSRRTVPQLLCYGLAGVIPFVPYLISQVLNGFSDFQRLGQYSADTAERSQELMRLLTLWQGVFANGSDGLLRLYGPESELGRWLWLGLLAALLLAAMVGVLAQLRHSARPIALLLAFVQISFLFLMVIRPITPYWMIFSLLPVAAVLLALGWRRVLALLFRAPVMHHTAIVSLVIVAATFQIQLVRNMLAAGQHIRMPILEAGSLGFMNVPDRFDDTTPVNVSRIDFHAFEPYLGDDCAPATYRLHWSHLMETTLGAGVRLHCGNTDSVYLGGPKNLNRAERAALSRTAAASIGLTGPSVGSLVLVPNVEVVYTGRELKLPIPDRFPPRQDLAPPSEISLQFEAPANAVVGISNRTEGYFPIELMASSCPGEVVERYRDPHLMLLQCAPHQGGSWSLNLRTSIDVIEIATIRLQRGDRPLATSPQTSPQLSGTEN